jgi:two-component system sensor histidine kinase UhpB
MESLRAGVMVVDPGSQRIVAANPFAAELLGDPGSASGPTCRTIGCLTKDGFCPAADPANQVRASEMVLRRPDGTEIRVIKTVARLALDGRQYMVESFVDISSQRRTDRVFGEAEARYRALVEEIPAVTYTAALDEASTTLYVSPQIKDLLGYTPEEYAADPGIWRRQVHPEDRERVLMEVLAGREEGRPFVSEYRMLTRSGNVVWVKDRAVVVPDASGKPVALQGVMLDITERRQAETDLSRSHEELRGLLRRLEGAREEERTRIARDIHDDLGQNLTALKMDLRWIERALEKAGSPQQPEGIRSRAASAIELADAMSSGVQRLAAELRPGVLDKLGLEPAIRFEIRQFAARTGIRCRILVPAALPQIHPAAATALFRICQECLTNVARHSHATIACVSLTATDGDVVMRIEDNGSGIAEEAIDNSLSLGLLGMRERAAALGGEVLFRRRGRGGSAVTVRIPNHGT